MVHAAILFGLVVEQTICINKGKYDGDVNRDKGILHNILVPIAYQSIRRAPPTRLYRRRTKPTYVLSLRFWRLCRSAQNSTKTAKFESLVLSISSASVRIPAGWSSQQCHTPAQFHTGQEAFRVQSCFFIKPRDARAYADWSSESILIS